MPWTRLVGWSRQRGLVQLSSFAPGSGWCWPELSSHGSSSLQLSWSLMFIVRWKRRKRNFLRCNDRTWTQKIQMMTSSHCTTRSPSYVLKSASQLLRIPTEPRLGETQVGVQVANLWSWRWSEFRDLIEVDYLIPTKKGTGESLRAATTPLPQWADIHKALFAVSGNCRVQQSEKET